MQELRQGVQLLLQFGEAFEARMRGGTEVPLSTLPLQNEAQIQLEHASERQAYETFERILHYAKWEQAVIHHGHWELIIASLMIIRISSSCFLSFYYWKHYLETRFRFSRKTIIKNFIDLSLFFDNSLLPFLSFFFSLENYYY